MKESSRQRITQRLAQLDGWRASGLSIEAYAQSLGQRAAQWRAWVSWESRWRRMLKSDADALTNPTPGFVKDKPSGQPARPPVANPVDGNVVLVLTRLGCGVSVRAHWPLHAMASSAAWLREVLA